MRQAISTKYHGPTNFRGARVTAYAQAGKVTLCWDYALDIVPNHEAAARALATKYGWGWENGQWAGGGLADSNNHAYAWVQVDQ